MKPHHKKTFLDTGVLIKAFQSPLEEGKKAFYEVFGDVYTLTKKGPVILDFMKVSVNNKRPSHQSVHSPYPLY